MPQIRKPAELPMDYLHVYWANWWASFTRRGAVYPDAVMACIECKKEGLIGFQLKHRGVPSTRINLMCDRCWSKNCADRKAPTSQRKMGKTRSMQGDGPRVVLRPRRRPQGRT